MSGSVKNLCQITAEEIRTGKFGPSGELFPSIRTLASDRGVSYVTAQRVAVKLREMGLLMLCGSRLYITCGPLEKKSALAHYLSEHRLEHRLIGMYINRMDNVFFTSIARHLSDELSKHGYELFILSGGQEPLRERHALETFVAVGAEAVISCPGFGEEVGEAYRDYILPVVFIGRHPDFCENRSAVLVNNINAGKQAAEHLMSVDCVNFAYIGTNQLSRKSDMRLEGFIRGLTENGYSIPTQNIFWVNADTPSIIPPPVKQFIKTCEKPLGLFCYHDMLAVNIISFCHRFKINLPDNIKIVGFDNLPAAEFVTPTLTSISYRFDLMAQTACREVLRLIDGEKSNGEIYVNQTLIIRGSTQ